MSETASVGSPKGAAVRLGGAHNNRGSLVGWISQGDGETRSTLSRESRRSTGSLPGTSPSPSLGAENSPRPSFCQDERPATPTELPAESEQQGEVDAGSKRLTFTGSTLPDSCAVVFRGPLKHPSNRVKNRRASPQSLPAVPSNAASNTPTHAAHGSGWWLERRQESIQNLQEMEVAEETASSDDGSDSGSSLANSESPVAEITQAEYNNFHRMFTAYDADGSGTIDADELGHIMQALGVPMDDDALHKLLCGALGVEQMEQASNMKNVEIEFPEFVELMAKQKELLMKKEDNESPPDYIAEVMKSRHFLIDSPIRWVVDTLLFLAIAYYSITVPCRFVTTPRSGGPMEEALLALEILFHLLFCVDIALKFFTIPAVVPDSLDNPLTDLSRRDLFWMYVKSPQFFLDTLTSVPLELLYYRADGVNLAFRAFKMMKIQRVPYLYASSGSLRVMTPGCVSFLYSVVPLTNLVFWLVACIHWFSISWLFFGVRAECSDMQAAEELVALNETEVALLGDQFDTQLLLSCSGDRYLKDGGGELYKVLEFLSHDFNEAYLNAIYVVLYTITTVGYGDAKVRSIEQKVLACFLFVVGAVINGFVVSKINRVLSQSDISSERKAKMVEMVNILRFFDIPAQIQREILSFQHHLLDHNLSSAYSEIIDALPINMQEQLSLYHKLKLVSKVPLFNSGSVHDECKIAIAQSLTNTVAQPNEFIICAGEVGREMCFLGHGVAEVLHPTGHHLATIRKGQFFGEMALVFARGGESKRTASVKALTYCDLYCLFAGDFLDILSRFPKFRQVVDKEAYHRRKEMQLQNGSIGGKPKRNPLESRKKKDDQMNGKAPGSSDGRDEPTSSSSSSGNGQDEMSEMIPDTKRLRPNSRTSTSSEPASAWQSDRTPAREDLEEPPGSPGVKHTPIQSLSSAASISSDIRPDSERSERSEGMRSGFRQTVTAASKAAGHRQRLNSDAGMRQGPPPLGELKMMKRKTDPDSMNPQPRDTKLLFRDAAKRVGESAVQRAAAANPASRFAGIVQDAVSRRASFTDMPMGGASIFARNNASSVPDGIARESLNTMHVQLSTLSGQVTQIIGMLERGESSHGGARRSTVFGAHPPKRSSNFSTLPPGGKAQSISRMEFQRIQRNLQSGEEPDALGQSYPPPRPFTPPVGNQSAAVRDRRTGSQGQQGGRSAQILSPDTTNLEALDEVNLNLSGSHHRRAVGSTTPPPE
eukprot:TRINITY_DN16519_c0_g1_i1.p1 TRINITY_DN16519_c0_g1~~TRINITY_DN16519_c0_g1_i1.p1  ORF type:complete len:1290 (+),score=366.73 TRINITY_DN16519_c0_g1_i1:210-3872(+)